MSALPVTVIAAIIIFLLKEAVEGIRRYRAEARRKRALRALLARDCELNYWTIKSVRHIVETIREENEADEATKFYFLLPRSGKTLFKVERQDTKMKSGSALASTHKDVMEKNLLEVATLDKRLYAVLEAAYETVLNLEHVRSSLMYYVDPEDDQDKMFLDAFIDYALRELDICYADLDALYRECVGRKLEKHRLW